MANSVVGEPDGASEGLSEGFFEGLLEGLAEGLTEGLSDGESLTVMVRSTVATTSVVGAEDCW